MSLARDEKKKKKASLSLFPPKNERSVFFVFRRRLCFSLSSSTSELSCSKARNADPVFASPPWLSHPLLTPASDARESACALRDVRKRKERKLVLFDKHANALKNSGSDGRRPGCCSRASLALVDLPSDLLASIFAPADQLHVGEEQGRTEACSFSEAAAEARVGEADPLVCRARHAASSARGLLQKKERSIRAVGA